MTATATPSAPTDSASTDARELPSPAAGKAPPLTVIAEGTRVEGLVDVTGDLRVDGRVEGRLLASGAACEISRAGTVAVDTARAVSIVVHGTLRASEIVARRVTVTATGVVQAQVLAAESVEVEMGGALEAMLEIGGGERAEGRAVI